MVAVILGNGESRRKLKYQISNDYTLYGCNAIYRDQEVDHLISVDVKMQHEIYSSGYAYNHDCWFNDWTVHDAVEADIVRQLNYNITENERGNSTQCHIAGTHKDLYITWLKEDKVHGINYQESAGTIAMKLAIEQGHKNLFLAGFDLDQSKNIYTGTHAYEHSFYGNASWEQDHRFIISMNEDVEFCYVGCKFPSQEFSNVKIL